jgi:proline iminopeptidase
MIHTRLRYQTIALLNTITLLCLCSSSTQAQSKTSTDTISAELHGRYLQVNKARIWVELEGKGRPLFLLAGGPGSSHAYMHQFSRLKEEHLLVYLDSYGRGRSDTALQVSEYGLNRDVEDMEGVRKALGFDKIDVLGHSYGGVLAQAYAVKYRESVAHLVLANTFFSGEMWQANDDNSNKEIETNYPEIWKDLMAIRLEGARSSDPAHQHIYGQVPYGFLYAYNPASFESAPSDSVIRAEKKMPHPHKFNSKLYYQFVGVDGDFIIGGDIANMDFRKELKSLTMPMLIYTGRYDRVAVPKFALLYAHYAPQARFVIFEKSGHNPQVEEPAKLFPLLKEFLKS